MEIRPLPPWAARHRIPEGDLSVTTPLTRHLTFDSPAVYQICVCGSIAPSWKDRLEGMSIHQVSRENKPTITVLHGMLFDQAALAGVLNTLYGLHLPVLSVKLLRTDRIVAPSSQS